MNKVECNVDNCSHFSNNYCGLDQIKVDGPAAKEKYQTCCLSFDKKQLSMSNSSASGSAASIQTGISCMAENCVHNCSSKCDADTISVGCSAGNPTVKSSTECETFIER